jgi:hypothetical protein
MSDISMVGVHQRIRRWPWGTLFGFTAVGFYITFTIIAINRYPQKISPLDSYLSMLGNADVSPDGASIYNLGAILMGLAEVPFFIAIYAFYLRYSQKWLLLSGLLVGLINGLAIFMTGINPLSLTGDISAHVTWSYIIFFSMIPMLVAFSLVLWKTKGNSRYVGIYGFAVCAIDTVFLVTLLSGHIGAGLGSIMEWFLVFSYLAWIVFISIDVLVKSRANAETVMDRSSSIRTSNAS